MATPPRVVRLECPACRDSHWEIDSDYNGADLIGEEELGYPERRYSCPSCKRQGPGWAVRNKSPVAFLLQPSDAYPMRRSEFEYWAGILRAHCPDHPFVPEIGREFRPNTHVMRTHIRNFVGKALGWH